MTEVIRIVDQVSPADLEELDDEIYRFNREATGHHDGRSLAAFLRDERGVLRAGLAGHTWGGYCEIRFLFVRAEERRCGLGTALLGAAEAEAARRGCDRVVLATHSFQAPDFYRRHGYVEIGRADGYPRGYAQLYLLKQLSVSPAHAARA
jgi:GNAT superfamily N-acetyltransferase